MFLMILTNLAPLLNAFDHLVDLYKGGFTLLNLGVTERVFPRFERALEHS